MDYISLAVMAASMGYTEFTDLQKNAFRDPRILDPHKNILVIGPTSSGKTLIPMLMYYQRVQEAERAGRDRPKMLFVVPYKALASQKSTELVAPYQKRYGGQNPLRTAQSTGEYRYADNKIREADTDVAVVISEKAFLFSCEDHAFLSRFDEVVLDEVGLLADEGRGAKLDFLLVWCRMMQKQYGRPRMTLLATPFYDWSAYVEKFDLALVESDARPPLRERPVYVAGHQEKKVAYPGVPGEDAPLPPMMHICREGKKGETRCFAADREGEEPYLCPVSVPCRQDQTLLCDQIHGPCQFPITAIPPGMPYKDHVIARLCRWHLRSGRQILIFWNNREEVRQLALSLYAMLRDILPPAPALEVCKKQVLDGCSRQIKSYDGSSLRSTEMTEDELFGILEDDHYRALCSGIGFHSSAVPNELRCYIEEQFLETGDLKIVCSTETLAFGVNSAVDVVIIADMTKTDGQRQRQLSANEYQNYVGRAGRLRPGLTMQEVVGWVHPIVNGHSPEDKRFYSNAGAYDHWRNIRDPVTTETMYSHIFDADNQILPFLLLCLLPENSKQAMTKDELREWLEQLPRVPGQPIQLDAALGFLLGEKLADVYRMGRRAAVRKEETRYYITEKGRKVRGYTPSIGDYRCILKALRRSLAPDPGEAFTFREAVFIYHLLDAPCLKGAVDTLDTGRLEAKREQRQSGTEPEPAAPAQDRTISREKLEKLIDGLPVRQTLQPLLRTVDLTSEPVRKKCLLTAAVLCWADSMNPHRLYDLFAITYPLIQTLTQQMSFLMDIALRLIDEMPWGENESAPAYIQRQKAAAGAIGMLSRSVYYGIHRELYAKMLQFFQNEPGEDSRRIYENLASLQPSVARQLRRITEYCRLLSGPPSGDKALVNRKLAARKEIRDLGPLWIRFIQTTKEE